MTSNIKEFDDKRAEFTERILQHSFIKRCNSGEVDMAELRFFLGQHGIYSSYFTRFLCALMANLPSNEEVRALSANLFEELGLQGDDRRPHGEIYRAMLERFDLRLSECTPTRETESLIDTMLCHCRQPNPAYGLGALYLGAEALVPRMYSSFIHGFLANGVDISDIEFFQIHVDCDDAHAETLSQIMLRMAKADKSQMDIMLDAGRKMVDSRLRFLSAVEKHAEMAVRESYPG